MDAPQDNSMRSTSTSFAESRIKYDIGGKKKKRRKVLKKILKKY